jgi:competence protein ComEA
MNPRDDGRGGARGTLCWSCIALAAAATLAFAGGAGAPRSRFVPRRAFAPPQCRIDLSTAPVEELALLPGIGPQLAARIAADRAVHGAYGSVDGLARVEGIGERTIAGLRDSARASTP